MTTKKHEEELVTQIVLDALNEHMGTSYVPRVVMNEDTKVDTQGISSAPGEPVIDFQVTYADNGLPHEGGAVLSRNFRGPAAHVIDLTTPYDIAAAIERKQSRYTQEEAERLVLLIWKTKTCLIDPKGIDWNVDSIWFRACYFACLPGNGVPGQVVALKPLCLPDGRLFTT